MDQREDADEEAGSEREAEQPEAVASKGASAKRRKARREARAAREAEARRASASAGLSRSALVGVVALAAGAAVGWFAHDARAKARLTDESAAASASSNSGPCHDWQTKICGSSGDQSATCLQAKGAAELLTPATCESALTAMPATLAKIKVARASCNNLVKKLCGDLPKGSRSCAMVTERTDSFPAERCKELLEHYDEVLSELKQLDGLGGPPGTGGPPGAPQGMPPGHP